MNANQFLLIFNEMASKIIPLLFVLSAVCIEFNIVDGWRYGCHKGYCWANCVAISLISGEWCYTSKSDHTQSYEYVKCTDIKDCKSDWKCASACMFF